MVAADTNVLVRWLMRDSPSLAAEADRIINQAGAGSILLDRIILAEFSYVLKSYYQHTKSEIALNLNAIMDTNCFLVPDRELVKQAVGYYANERPLSFEDCWLLALRRAGKVEDVLTFDANLQKQLTK